MTVCKSVWMVRSANYHKCFVTTMLFEDELDALRHACCFASNTMKNLGMDNHNHIRYSTYVLIMQMIHIDSHRSLTQALVEYDQLMNYELAEERTLVWVGMKPIVSKNKDVVENATEVASLPLTKVDKPCKQCKRNVSEDESFCWYCGVKDPGK